MKNKNQKLIQEDLTRFKSLFNYNQKTGLITEKVGPNRSAYFLNEADPEEGGEDNEDFDFGDAGNPEDTEKSDEGGGEEDFDFGDAGGEEGDTPEAEPEETDLGKSDEFSAADELEQEESDVEEIDVTELINNSNTAKETAEKAYQAAEKNNSYLETLTQRFDQITNSISKLDNILAKVAKIESDIKTPEEKLELRSLSSYPFNMKLTDYWETKSQDPNSNYNISDGEEGQRTYTIKLDDVKNYSSEEIKNTFNPKR